MPKHAARARWLFAVPLLLPALVARDASAAIGKVPVEGGGECTQAWAQQAFDITVLDAYGRPVVNAPVQLEISGYGCDFGTRSDALTAYTNASGHATATVATSFMSGQPIVTRWDVLIPRRAYTPKLGGGTVTAGPQTATVIMVPAADALIEPPGFDAGNGKARLYQSGAYDKPVVLTEGFDPSEQDPYGRREYDRLWMDFNGDPMLIAGQPDLFNQNMFMKRLYDEGYDVWVAEANSTGQSLHEQAAEYAQTVAYASRYQNGSRKVILMGYSLGGLMTRMVSSRWSNDAAWRNALGLQHTSPISAVVAADAPLRGASVPESFQRLLWFARVPGMKNLDSCGEHQMAQVSCQRESYEKVKICWVFGCSTLAEWIVPSCNKSNWEAFYHTGGSTGFRKADGTWAYCGSGPAVTTAGNGFGWPVGVPYSLMSNASPTEWNTCYKDSRDLTGVYSNGQYYPVCPDRSTAGTVTANTTWIGGSATIKIAGTLALSLSVGLKTAHETASPYFYNSDIEPGSRVDFSLQSMLDGVDLTRSLLGGFITVDGSAYQYASPTFIPARSSRDTNCIGCASSASVTWSPTYPSMHERIGGALGIGSTQDAYAYWRSRITAGASSAFAAQNRCGDYVCDGGSESCDSCASDCGACQPPASFCGDYVCNSGYPSYEDQYNCPSDCSSGPCGVGERCDYIE